MFSAVVWYFEQRLCTHIPKHTHSVCSFFQLPSPTAMGEALRGISCYLREVSVHLSVNKCRSRSSQSHSHSALTSVMRRNQTKGHEVININRFLSCESDVITWPSAPWWEYSFFKDLLVWKQLDWLLNLFEMMHFLLLKHCRLKRPQSYRLNLECICEVKRRINQRCRGNCWRPGNQCCSVMLICVV